MHPHIRIATPEDAAVINDVFAYYIANSVATFNEYNKTLEQRRQEMELLLRDYPFLIAEDEDGRFLGFANAEPVRPQSGYRFCVELTIYLHPDTPHRSGVGKLLYSHLLEMLAQQGYRTAFAVICGTNEESLSLHRSFGFGEVARFCNSGYKHGRWLDTVWMQKVLNPFDETPQEPVPFCEYRKQMML